MKTLLTAIVLSAAVVHAEEVDQGRIYQLQRQIRNLDEQKQKLELEQKKCEAQLKKLGAAPAPPGVPIPNPSPNSKPEEKEKDFPYLKIARSLTDKNNTDLPAAFQYVHQRNGGKDTKSFDLGVSVDLARALSDGENQRLELGVSSELHYNSAKDAKQNSFLAGFDANYMLARDGVDSAQFIFGHLKYKNDRTKTGEGVQANVGYYPVIGSLGIQSPNELNLCGLELGYEIRPEVSLEIETGDGSLKGFHDGDRDSLKAGLALLLSWPHGGKVSKEDIDRWQLNNSVIYWNHFATSGGYDRFHDNQVYFQSSLIYYPDSEKRLGIGVDYLHGDNATEGKFNVSEVDMSLKFKY